MNSNCNSCNQSNLIIEQTINMVNAVVGDDVEYCIKVINNGNTLINGITIIDNLDCNLNFVKGSVCLDNSNCTVNILKGINIGFLRPNEFKIVTFKATIISMPKNGYINNFAVAKYFYDESGCNQFKIMDKRSNIICLKVDIAELEVSKFSSKETVSLGDTVSYEIDIRNIGTLEAIGVLFMDKLPKEVTLIPHTFMVNGQVINYIDDDIKIYVGDLCRGESVKIEYSVEINSSNCKGLICNKAYAMFNFNLCNHSFGEKISYCSEKSTSKIKLGMSTFKQLCINRDLCVSPCKPGIKEINNIQTDIIIDDYYDIATPKIISSEGQILTGNKLIIRGFFNEILEYISDDSMESICIDIYKIPFSTFIILPEDYVLGSNLAIETVVEDVSLDKINCRSFFMNITFLINAKILCC